MSLGYKILQIIPADGWYAVYSEVDDSGAEYKERIVCFALIEDYEVTPGKTYRYVEPFGFDEDIGAASRISDVSNFDRIEHEGELSDEKQEK